MMEQTQIVFDAVAKKTDQELGEEILLLALSAMESSRPDVAGLLYSAGCRLIRSAEGALVDDPAIDALIGTVGRRTTALTN